MIQFETEFFFCDLVTSEMIKHATNTFLASSISFANELARIGEAKGVDNQKVAQALRLDKRIGKLAYVAPGLGFAGGTLPRDLRILQKMGKQFHLPTPYIDAILTVNESTAKALLHSLSLYLGTLKEKKILILGYPYKADIDTLRRSASIESGAALKQSGSTVLGYDPVMNKSDLSELKGIIEHQSDWNEIQNCPDAVVIMTARAQFANLEWQSLIGKPTAGKPGSTIKPLILDTTAKTPSTPALKAGFVFKPLWQPIQTGETNA